MARYCCYFLCRNGRPLVAEDIEALSDGAAIAQARRAFAQWPMLPGFELWLNDELIHAENSGRPAASARMRLEAAPSAIAPRMGKP